MNRLPTAVQRHDDNVQMDEESEMGIGRAQRKMLSKK